MNEKFKKDLEKLAKKYGMLIYFQCNYCGENTVSCEDEIMDYLVTFAGKQKEE